MSSAGERLAAIGPPDSPVFRVGRAPDPFALPDWNFSGDDGTFGNRFDDPAGMFDLFGRRTALPRDQRFRMIYCSTHRAGAFGETLARFRPSIRMIARLHEIDDTDPLDPDLIRGVIPADWRFKRRLGIAELDQDQVFLNLNHAATMTRLLLAMAPVIDALGLNDLDLGDVSSRNRRLTLEIVRYVYQLGDPTGIPMFAGIRYVSRLHNQWECWAKYSDRMSLHGIHAESIFVNDPGLVEAASILGLRLPAS